MDPSLPENCTVADELFSPPLQVLGAVCLERGQPVKLLEAAQEVLLLLLRVGCQNLLGQSQFLVPPPLLTGRGQSGERTSAGALAGLHCLPRSRYVLYDLCVDEEFWRYCPFVLSESSPANVAFRGCDTNVPESG